MFKKVVISAVAAMALLFSAQSSADKNRSVNAKNERPVAIIGILASIALPAYQDYTRRGINNALNQHTSTNNKDTRVGKKSPKNAKRLKKQNKKNKRANRVFRIQKALQQR